MSIATQITRIQTDRNTIRAKLVELGLATGTDNLDVLATAIDGIVDNGDITANVKEGETYTIPAGYHSGAGTVSGIAGGGNYSLQSKNVTPTKKQQTITSDDGYYGLADVVVAPIPDAYQDVTSVTAAAADVLTGKTIVTSNGTVTAGSMVNNGAVSKTLTTADASYTVPQGYHDGKGSVKIVPEDKSVTPTKAAQEITAEAGKVLNKVSVAAIPDNFIDTTDATAEASHILIGETAYVNTVKVEGSMPNNGAVNKTLDVSATSMTIAEGYHNGTGSVNIVLEEKSATPTKAAQAIAPTAGKVLSKVTVAAIPDAYQDVTAVTATSDKVLVGSDFVDSTGTVVNGAMANNGAVSKTLDVNTTSYTVPQGYHDGTGVINVVTETKSATPTKEEQVISATNGKVMSKVTVAAIPAAYQDVTAVDATAADVLDGKKIVAADGTVVTGAMANNGDVSGTIDGLTTLSVTIPAGYTTGGTVSLTDDIEQALAAI